jgi:hypothetical protein
MSATLFNLATSVPFQISDYSSNGARMEYIGLIPMRYKPGVGSGWIAGPIDTIRVLFPRTAVGAAPASAQP